MAEHLKNARRLVIKVGSSLLVDADSGRLREEWLTALADDVAALHRRGQEVLLVSSGAIALGRRVLGLKAGALKLEESQAAAATGQIRLAHAYQNAMARHNIQVAQILLTLGDTEQRRQYLNARATINTLLTLRTVPVINENDTVATSEIRYGDNDRLAARVAQMASADCLILLSDIDGLYTADPGLDPNARFIPEVAELTPEIEAMGGGSRSGLGRGGMATKIAAARIAMGAGCHMAIASGKVMNPVSRIENGGKASWFIAPKSPALARKQWIAGHLNPKGVIVIDGGAEQALRQGRSLLPAGVRAVEGQFSRGDAVTVKGQDGRDIARGLIAYGLEDALRIMGRNSRDIEQILGYRGRDEMIHRDDLVIL